MVRIKELSSWLESKKISDWFLPEKQIFWENLSSNSSPIFLKLDKKLSFYLTLQFSFFLFLILTSLKFLQTAYKDEVPVNLEALSNTKSQKHFIGLETARKRLKYSMGICWVWFFQPKIAVELKLTSRAYLIIQATQCFLFKFKVLLFSCQNSNWN